MMMQKKLSGELKEWDPDARLICVRFKKWWETGHYTEATARFVLDSYAIVTSAYCGTMRLSELQKGQQVTVTYSSGRPGYPVAHTLSVSKAVVPMKDLLGVGEGHQQFFHPC